MEFVARRLLVTYFACVYVIQVLLEGLHMYVIQLLSEGLHMYGIQVLSDRLHMYPLFNKNQAA